MSCPSSSYVAQHAPDTHGVGTENALHSIVARKVAEFLDKAATHQRLVRMQQRLRQLRNRLEEALETATDNRKRAERVLVRCRQT